MPPMQWGLALALVTALAVQDPMAAPAKQLTLELRMFSGAEEVTAQTRATVHRAGDRGEPLLQAAPSDGRIELRVPAGIYDVQAIHERDGRVLNIRWANRLVVMPYPDERGHHLEVINFKNGFGALQIREPGGGQPDVALYEQGKRDKPATASVLRVGLSPLRRTGGSLRSAGAGDGKVHMARRGGRAARSDAPLDHALIASTDAAPCAERAGRRAEAPAVPPVPTRQRSLRPRP